MLIEKNWHNKFQLQIVSLEFQNENKLFQMLIHIDDLFHGTVVLSHLYFPFFRTRTGQNVENEGTNTQLMQKLSVHSPKKFFF